MTLTFYKTISVSCRHLIRISELLNYSELSYNEVLGTCKFLRYKRILINTFSALGGNLHFVISDLVIKGVYCHYYMKLLYLFSYLNKGVTTPRLPKTNNRIE